MTAKKISQWLTRPGSTKERGREERAREEKRERWGSAGGGLALLLLFLHLVPDTPPQSQRSPFLEIISSAIQSPDLIKQ